MQKSVKSLFIHYSCLVKCGGAWSVGLHMQTVAFFFKEMMKLYFSKKHTIPKLCSMSMSRMNLVTMGLQKPKYYPSPLKLKGFL